MNAMLKFLDQFNDVSDDGFPGMDSPFGKLKRVRINESGFAEDISDRSDQEFTALEELQNNVPLEPVISVEELIAEAVARERAEAARILEEKLFEQKKICVEAVRREREVWVAEQAEVLKSEFMQAIAEIASRIENKVADVLEPFVVEQFKKQAVSEVADVVNQAIGSADQTAICLMGPADLIDSVSEKMSKSITLKVKANDENEVSIFMEETLVESQLTDWSRRLHSYVAAN